MEFFEPPASCKVYTPLDLARAITLSLTDEPQARWLEPSHGRGAFVTAIAELGVPQGRIRAVDLDCTPSNADSLAMTLRSVDFLEWSQRTSERFDRIVGNPPYVAINKLSIPHRAVAAGVHGPDGRPIGIGANMWSAFVIRSISLLRNGGSFAFVLPSASEYADYAKPIRDVIGTSFRNVEVYRCRQSLFDGVQDGAVVVVARYRSDERCRFRRRMFAARPDLVSALTAPRPFTLRACPGPCASQRGVMFGEIADIRVGGVTGDSRYFLLTEDERLSRSLPVEACRPVVSKARHLVGAAIGKHEWGILRKRNERVWLFDPPKGTLGHPGVRRYLDKGENGGGCKINAHKIRIRKPWFRTPMPKRPHGFISGMSQFGPWLCMSRSGKLNATNTLYVVSFRDDVEARERYAYALSLLSSPVQQQLKRSARRYTDGLIKHEPGAIARLKIPAMRIAPDIRKIYSEAVALLLKGNRREARRLADSMLVGSS